MTMRRKSLLAVLVGAGLLAGGAHGQSAPELKFSGFGTLAAVGSDNRDADFVSTIFQPSGVGFTRPWALTPDSRLGGQLDAVFNSQWSAVVQVVSQHRHDNSFIPQLEWANVKFQATPELSLRVGRIAAPSFLVSDSRFVGYAQPWIRPPVEVYGVLPITSNDGVDLTYRRQFSSFTNTFQAYYGRAKARLETGAALSRPGWGINNTAQFGDLTLRAGYTANNIDLELPDVIALIDGYRAFTAMPGATGAQAAAIVDRYPTRGIRLGAFSLAASYDPGNWFVMSELVEFRGEGILADSRSWYATAGWRMGSVTPYVTYARTRSKVTSDPGLPVAAAAPLNAGLDATLNSQFNGSQSTTSLGVRWDFMKNVAFKAQYDYVDLGAGSAGRFTDVQPAFQRGGHVNLFSLGLDFVF